MPVLTNDMSSTRLVLLDIDRLKHCPYCGHVVKIEYDREGGVLAIYKTCNVADCGLKLVIT